MTEQYTEGNARGDARPWTHRRTAGVLLPLFSVRSRTDWGVGELPDLARLAPLLERGGLSVLMTLPLLEPSPGQESPYSPVSGFAIDPLYISIDAIEEMAALGGREALDMEDRGWLRAARGSRGVRHDAVRPLKRAWLRRCHAEFEANASPERRAELAEFREANAHWLGDYALFRTLKDHHPQSWRAWPSDLRRKDPAAVEAARAEHRTEIAEREYTQWIAFRQLEKARAALSARGIGLGGDEPFLVAEDSADVWARQELYRFDATVGAPPDAFSATGQDWGLPPYAWDKIAAEDYALFTRRGAHAARLFDLVRIDHVVGLYRTYHRPTDGSEPFFVPDEPGAQRAQGEAVMRAFASAGLSLIAEDLGVIPDFVRASLEQLDVPGFRVLRWEERGGQMRLPDSWPERSVATLGTHDTETSAAWWDTLSDRDRALMRTVPQVGAVPEDLSLDYNRHIEHALLEAIYESPSSLALLPIQDLFGIRDRINVPNTVGPHNWTWRLPWSLEAMDREDQVSGPLDDLASLARRTLRVRITGA